MTYPDGTNARLIEVAAAEVGTIEEGDNLTKYGKFTKADGLPWCGSFVNWCANQAGVKIHSVVGTAVGAHKFKEMQRWSTMPQLGYLAFMDFPHDGVDRISHIGIVVGLIDTKTCLTIEATRLGQAINATAAWLWSRFAHTVKAKKLLVLAYQNLCHTRANFQR
jgi:hypothetical protein